METITLTPKLYDIPQELEALAFQYEQLLTESAGEVTPEVEAVEKQIRDYIAAGTDKIESAACVVRMLEKYASIAKEEGARYIMRAKAFENNADRLKSLIGSVLNAFGGKVKTPKFTVFNKANPKSFSLVIAPDCDLMKLREQWPEYIKVQAEPKKSLIVDAFKNGTAIPSEFTVTENPTTTHVEIR